MAALNYLTIDAAKAIDKYMSILSHMGYKSYCSVNKLLVYLYIEELLSKYNFTIPEKDYHIILNTLNCLYGSCVIPFHSYTEEDTQKEYVFFV